MAQWVRQLGWGMIFEQIGSADGAPLFGMSFRNYFWST